MDCAKAPNQPVRELGAFAWQRHRFYGIALATRMARLAGESACPTNRSLFGGFGFGFGFGLGAVTVAGDFVEHVADHFLGTVGVEFVAHAA